MVSASDDLPPLPKIGRIDAAMMAIDFALTALTKRPDRSAEPAVPAVAAGGDPELEDLVAALANLAAVLLQFIQITSRRNGAEISGARLLEAIGRDQQIHEARRQMESLDEGFPFDVG